MDFFSNHLHLLMGTLNPTVAIAWGHLRRRPWPGRPFKKDMEKMRMWSLHVRNSNWWEIQRVKVGYTCFTTSFVGMHHSIVVLNKIAFSNHVSSVITVLSLRVVDKFGLINRIYFKSAEAQCKRFKKVPMLYFALMKNCQNFILTLSRSVSIAGNF